MHSSRRSSPLFISVGALTLAASSSAPARAQAVLETPSATVEVLGLERWTVQMLQDSLAARAPGTSLTSHACAAVLRAKLGFADAAVVQFGSGGRAKKYVAITVVEPQDSARVRYRPEFADTLRDHEPWREAASLLASDPGTFFLVLQDPAVLVAARAEGRDFRSQPTAGALRAFLEWHSTAADRERALATLARDGNHVNRIVAVAILANFAAEDSVWWALADALRDPDRRVGSAAAFVLITLARAAPRAVDWTGAAPALRAVLDGTNLFNFHHMLAVLDATKVHPSLSRPLLGGGGELVLAYLGSRDPDMRRAARRLLVRLRGKDLGDNPRRWARWIASL